MVSGDGLRRQQLLVPIRLAVHPVDGTRCNAVDEDGVVLVSAASRAAVDIYVKSGRCHAIVIGFCRALEEASIAVVRSKASRCS